ncbi:MAG: hypothetical protein ACM36C_14290 [Acidobacteriota bacterium]
MTELEHDLSWFRSFVEESRWRFARTYVDSYPHEYTHEDWVEQGSLARAVECIERWGVVESFWRARRKYLYVDDRKYWHMGDGPEQRATLINRTWLDVGRYRAEAQGLGYNGERLDQLVTRWQALLDKAKT